LLLIVACERLVAIDLSLHSRLTRTLGLPRLLGDSTKNYLHYIDPDSLLD
jgi:hypothetical protein